MSALTASFPSLASELSRSLRVAGRAVLADQVDAAAIARVSFDAAANAAYIYAQPSRHLNAVETNIDTDNLGRLVGIEILAPCDLKDELRKYACG